jgi:hypothetical protein
MWWNELRAIISPKGTVKLRRSINAFASGWVEDLTTVILQTRGTRSAITDPCKIRTRMATLTSLTPSSRAGQSLAPRLLKPKGQATGRTLVAHISNAERRGDPRLLFGLEVIYTAGPWGCVTVMACSDSTKNHSFNFVPLST